MARKDASTTLPFDPAQVMDEWRRFYDWAVLSRRREALIEAISGLGQKFSATFNAYRLAKKPQRREHLLQELRLVFASMQTFYNCLPLSDRIPLAFLPHQTPC